jgi:hypothetical protein
MRIYHNTTTKVCAPICHHSVHPNVTIGTNQYKCKYCDNVYKYRQGCSRHEQICEIRTKNENDIEILKQKIKALEDKLNTQQPINTTNNINMGTVNTNYIIKFGSEQLELILNKEEMKQILGKKLISIEESIKQVHLNKNKPELNNIQITNLKNDIIYTYDGEDFVAGQKNDVLEELIDVHLENIEQCTNKENENNIRKELDEKIISKSEELIDKIEDDEKITISGKTYPNYKSYKMDNIKTMIYNYTKKTKQNKKHK